MNLDMNLKKCDKQMEVLANNMVDTLNKSYLGNTPYVKHINSYSRVFQYVIYCSMVKDLFPDKSSKILDWGGQYGHVSLILSSFFSNVDCYLPTSVKSYEETKGIKTYISEVHELLGVRNVKHGLNGDYIDLPDNSYDVVISSGVLEHVREESEKATEVDLLKEIHRVLKPNGCFIYWNLPHKFGSVELLNRSLGRHVHDFTYSKSDVINMMNESGFEIMNMDKHEFLNMIGKSILSCFIGRKGAWTFDYNLSKLPLIRRYFQHFTGISKVIK